ncbi:hypothetical protein DFP72DRAFT_862744 [Ephemerocybe angulata]|uniref:Uncharacterized protein n=1 Tax=Ephemerocybe angulata TaxID=980116 RepID=A0A8H6LT39_9AGAR|nr:hypothetical protein DFP72DRAFT_862744 [Tulosesus angulatus]
MLEAYQATSGDDGDSASTPAAGGDVPRPFMARVLVSGGSNAKKFTHPRHRDFHVCLQGIFPLIYVIYSRAPAAWAVPRPALGNSNLHRHPTLRAAFGALTVPNDANSRPPPTSPPPSHVPTKPKAQRTRAYEPDPDETKTPERKLELFFALLEDLDSSEFARAYVVARGRAWLRRRSQSLPTDHNFTPPVRSIRRSEFHQSQYPDLDSTRLATVNPNRAPHASYTTRRRRPAVRRHRGRELDTHAGSMGYMESKLAQDQCRTNSEAGIGAYCRCQDSFGPHELTLPSRPFSRVDCVVGVSLVVMNRRCLEDVAFVVTSILSPVLWASLTVFLQDGSGLAFRRRRHAQCAIFLRIPPSHHRPLAAAFTDSTTQDAHASPTQRHVVGRISHWLNATSLDAVGSGWTRFAHCSSGREQEDAQEMVVVGGWGTVPSTDDTWMTLAFLWPAADCGRVTRKPGTEDQLPRDLCPIRT